VVFVLAMLVASGYLSASWFFAYIWAGAWNAELLKNLICIFIGVFFGLIWLGYWISARSKAAYWVSTIWAAVVALLLIWDWTQHVLPVRAQVIDIAFSIISLALLIARSGGAPFKDERHRLARKRDA
jgi:hypothetical protein